MLMFGLKPEDVERFDRGETITIPINKKPAELRRDGDVIFYYTHDGVTERRRLCHAIPDEISTQYYCEEEGDKGGFKMLGAPATPGR